jgi:hypothetical protein
MIEVIIAFIVGYFVGKAVGEAKKVEGLDFRLSFLT